ncbi:hypothetical protein [Anaerosinus sp.]
MISDSELDMAIIKLNDAYVNEEVNLPDECDIIVPALLELKEHRESSLRPATKFLANTIGQQLSHIHQEFKEVELELGYGCLGIDKAVEELIDLQTACETMLAILGLDEKQRMQARRKVIEKNQARGYYCE